MAVHGAGGGWYVGHDSGGGGGGKMGRWSLVDGGRPRECSAVLPPLPPWLALHNLLPPRAVRPNSSSSPYGPRASESTPGKLLPSQEICSKITRHQISDMEWRSSVLGLSTRQFKSISPMFWPEPRFINYHHGHLLLIATELGPYQPVVCYWALELNSLLMSTSATIMILFDKSYITGFLQCVSDASSLAIPCSHSFRYWTRIKSESPPLCLI